MKTLCKTQGSETYFIMADVEPAYHESARALYYMPMKEGFGKAFPSDTPDLARIYSNFQKYAEEMVLQMASVNSVPWENCLTEFLKITESQNIDWWLCGSAALAVRGMEIEPHDIDLVVADEDSQKLGNLLLEYMVEPVVKVEDWFCNWFGRAFLGARLEWVGGIDERADQPEISDFGPTAESRLDTVVYQGREIRVPPLDLQLEVNKRRGLKDRVNMIESAITICRI